jgi:hypothetical protein
MSGWFDKLRKDEAGGISAVEFAFVLPLLLTILLTLTELGRGYFQANAVEKGVRAAALYAARAEYPLSAADNQTVVNLLRTGTLDGSGSYLAPGWSAAGASYLIEQTDFDLGGTPVPVYRVTATVPFDTLMPGVMAMLGLDDTLTIQLTHEQAYVGD